MTDTACGTTPSLAPSFQRTHAIARQVTIAQITQIRNEDPDLKSEIAKSEIGCLPPPRESFRSVRHNSRFQAEIHGSTIRMGHGTHGAGFARNPSLKCKGKTGFLRVHASKIKGVLSGFDRVRFRGTLRMLANQKGMSCFLSIAGILLKEFKEWSMELTDRIRRAGAELAGQRQRPVKLTHVEGRCLHQYFYLQHPAFGFMQIRLQTWAPFTVHVM